MNRTDASTMKQASFRDPYLESPKEREQEHKENFGFRAREKDQSNMKNQCRQRKLFKLDSTTNKTLSGKNKKENKKYSHCISLIAKKVK